MKHSFNWKPVNHCWQVVTTKSFDSTYILCISPGVPDLAWEMRYFLLLADKVLKAANSHCFAKGKSQCIPSCKAV